MFLLKKLERRFAWNIFEAKSLLANLSGNGQVVLSSDDIETLNKSLVNQDLAMFLFTMHNPNLLSLKLLKWKIIQIQTIYISVKLMLVLPIRVQIVCGAHNAALGLKTVCCFTWCYDALTAH